MFSRRDHLTNSLISAALIFWICVESYHLFVGSAGLRVLKNLRAEEAVLVETVGLVRERHGQLKRHADMLNPKSIDKEFLEERVRAVLGYADPADQVILREEFERAIPSE
ncbi:MAG: hypothetical protein AAFR03_01835 [Pseudomonadota bacterium]